MEEGVAVSIEFPKITIKIEVAGTDSLLGALCTVFIARGFIKNIGVLEPDEIEFVIKRVHKDLDLYAEINKVRDILKIKEEKIKVTIES
jgi:hypothetical protein